MAPHGSARRLSTVTASIAPAAVLVFLPKCPLCLAGWLTVATGVGVSAAGAEWLRSGMLLLCVAALAAIVMTRIRSHGRLRRGLEDGCTACRTASLESHPEPAYKANVVAVPHPPFPDGHPMR